MPCLSFLVDIEEIGYFAISFSSVIVMFTGMYVYLCSHLFICDKLMLILVLLIIFYLWDMRVFVYVLYYCMLC